MVKLKSSQIASIDEDNEFFSTLATEAGVDLMTLVTQMVMRHTTGAGATFVDDEVSPSFCAIVFAGTFKLEGENTCVILHTQGELKDYSVAALTVKQFAKDKGCVSVCFGDFNAPTNEAFRDKFGETTKVTLEVSKI